MTTQDRTRDVPPRDQRAAEVIRRAREESQENEEFLRATEKERRSIEPILRRAGLIR